MNWAGNCKLFDLCQGAPVRRRAYCIAMMASARESFDQRRATGVEGQAVSPILENKRLARERKTMKALIQCYCEDHHGTQNGLCPECQDLLDYATLRLERCRFGVEKPTCANCPVHCYIPKRREQVRVVMRYAGPKMLWRNPILAIRHVLDGRRKAPAVSLTSKQ